jgi:2-oxoacid:acceptor oxidoreductase delta subunit (pyruvate/2-ketoisovalerate family)
MPEKGWRELPIGAKIIEGGNSIEYETGSWRTFRPVVDKEKCINCMRCWLLCPDSAIYADNEEMVGYDFLHCKGCGICAAICPAEAIEMILESDKDTIETDERGIKIPVEGEQAEEKKE